MLKSTVRKSCWLLGGVTLAVIAAVSLSALPPNPPGGEWVQTALSSAYESSCTGAGCHEYCERLGHGTPEDLIPTGVLCCVDSSGNCPPGGEFVP